MFQHFGDGIIVRWFSACWHGHRTKPIVLLVNQISNRRQKYVLKKTLARWKKNVDTFKPKSTTAQKQCNNTRTHEQKADSHRRTERLNCQRHTQQSMRCYRVFFFFSCVHTCKFPKQKRSLRFVIYIYPLETSRSLFHSIFPFCLFICETKCVLIKENYVECE